MTRPIYALAALAAGAAIAPATACAVTTAPSPPPARQALVVLLHDHATRSAPGAHARRTGAVSAHRPLTGVHTVLPLLAVRAGAGGTRWLRVRLPGRPSGHTGWIAADATRRTSTPWAIVVHLRRRQVVVFDQGHAVRTFTATVGKPSTPTPRGRFFVEEAAKLGAGAAGGPFALASSARSRVLQEFDGGPGQIALHGTGGLSGGLGVAVSHGCVRLGTPAITWLARRVGAGVPLDVEES
jgi:lipoprotein-anchoring transpeptidase ErfK/SrfK